MIMIYDPIMINYKKVSELLNNPFEHRHGH